MEILKMRDVVRSKIKNADGVYEENLVIIKKYFQDKVWELSELALMEISKFIDNIEDIIYTNGKLTTNAIKDVTIFKNDDFELVYTFSGSYLSLQVFNVPDEIGESYALCLSTHGEKIYKDLKDFEFAIFRRGNLILNTLFSQPNYQANYPHAGSNCLRTSETLN